MSTGNQTTFEKPEFLSEKQFEEYYHKFPTFIQNSIDKQNRGELKPITEEELKKKSEEYLISKPIENDNIGGPEDCECET